MTTPDTMPIPQPEVTLRLPHRMERAVMTLEADAEAAFPDGEDTFIVPAGTVVQRTISHCNEARWTQDHGWIFTVETFSAAQLIVRPASDLAVSPVTWEEVPLVNVEAPAGTPE